MGGVVGCGVWVYLVGECFDQRWVLCVVGVVEGFVGDGEVG